VKLIIDHLIHDLQTLKACSLTCYSWYLAAVPHIHHTFVLRGDRRGGLKPLSAHYALGLLSFVKDIRLLRSPTNPNGSYHGSDLPDSCHFFAFTNIRSLTIQNLELWQFIIRPGRYFGHLMPTLQSLMLEEPRSTAQELSQFISLFPNLDDVDIRSFIRISGTSDEALVPFSTPKLQGQLTSLSTAVETWEHLVEWVDL
jgi:hypothetical protein